jgi:hypothetical protein
VAGWGSAALAASALVLAVVLPPILRPEGSGTRLSSSARLHFISQRAGQTFRGDPASIVVRLQLVGGRIVPLTSTRLRPDQGHIHLFVDGALVSMGIGLSRALELVPGRHVLQAEFVAADHAPFRPPIRTSVAFRVAGP